jgi:branched-chain amino acid aminotransferase
MYGEMQNSGQIWMNGKMIPWKDANAHVLSHGLNYGTGIFEGVRAYPTEKGAAIFRLREHTQRFLNSAHIINMPMPYSLEELIEAQRQVISVNKLKSAYIRPLAFYGPEHLGISTENLSTQVIIAGWEWGAYLGQDAIENGIRVRTSSFTRHHINVSMCRGKITGNYMNSCLALREAHAAGCQESLMLDPQGYVAEGSAENVFVIKDNQIYTPMLTSCLAGITRASVITLAQEFGYVVKESLITRDEVYIADEAFFTGTAAEVTPIVELDGRKIGSGKPGPITQQLQQAYFNVVEGRNPQYQNWLTLV